MKENYKRVELLYVQFKERLHEIAQDLYADLLHRGIIQRSEMNIELDRYYARHRMGLQDVYSYYSEQWDCYYRIQLATDHEFCDFLSQSALVFSRNFDITGLNVDYYMDKIRTLSFGSEEMKTLRLLFTEKWCRLLEDKEYNYQLHHIERLTQDYYRMIKTTVGQLENKGRSGDEFTQRLNWLQPNYDPLLRKKIDELSVIIRRNPVIKELCHLLGRKNPIEDKHFLAKRQGVLERQIRHASPTDIMGVTEGDNLNSLLPVEYCYMADGQLEFLFWERYTRKKLQVFDGESRQTTRVGATNTIGSDLSRPQLSGPFVICVDTSGSMAGHAEMIEKAIVLAVAFLSEKMQRRCRVVLFSDQTDVIEIDNLYDGIPLLKDFFCTSFQGGTNVRAAIEETVKSLQKEEFALADLLLLSDFEMETLHESLQEELLQLKERNVGVYTVAFGDNYNRYYLDVAHKYWILPSGSPI